MILPSSPVNLSPERASAQPPITQAEGELSPFILPGIIIQMGAVIRCWGCCLEGSMENPGCGAHLGAPWGRAAGHRSVCPRASPAGHSPARCPCLGSISHPASSRRSRRFLCTGGQREGLRGALPSQGTGLSHNLLVGEVRAGGECHISVAHCCPFALSLLPAPRGRWMCSQSLALASFLFLLPFTRDHKRAGPVQVMLCRTWVAMEPPRAPGVGLWGLCASMGGFMELLLGQALTACCPLELGLQQGCFG